MSEVSVSMFPTSGPIATFGALGCGRKASYVASECEIHPFTGELLNCQAFLNSDTKSSP